MQADITYPMDIANGSGWEVVVDHHVDTLEINATPHQISTNQDPDLHTNRTRALEGSSWREI